MVILVTGAGGYVGTVLVPYLVSKGHEVIALDRYFFGFIHQTTFSIKHDIRYVSSDIFKNVDAVIDLAALSNDPSGDLNHELTWDINCLGRTRIATLAKLAKVKRYILASSCAVYGMSKGCARENSLTNPLTIYAQANLQAEQNVLALSSDNFCVTVLRQATLCGLSPRMRFDLVLHQMILDGFRFNTITVSGDGYQWRPLLHVRDTARAMEKILICPEEKVSHQIFNLGMNNYHMFDLAHIIISVLNPSWKIVHQGVNDYRSYQIDCSKIANEIEFKPMFSLEKTIEEVYQALKNGLEYGPKTRTVEWYKLLLEMNVLLKDIKIDGKVL